MPSSRLITIDETSVAHAQVIRGLLESEGIPVWLNQESAGTAMGLNVLSTLGIVKIIVNEQNAERARALVDAYYRGDLQDDSQEDQG
jgi:Putative prokaryotic signal transducing protein